MASRTNRKIVLVRRPEGLPDPSCFRVEEEAVSEPAAGEVLVEVSHVSIDPFIETSLHEGSFHQTVPLGGMVGGLGVGRVLESAYAELKPGDPVFGPVGIQTLAKLSGPGVRKVDEKRAPLTAYLGALGLTAGLTSYFGMRDVGAVKAGETVVVSGAAGAVGSIAGQIAKIGGARVIGIAGGLNKVRYVVDDLGLDACIDYKGEDVEARLRELAPEGIDVYFDNVGGELLDIVLDQIRTRARIVICGAISQYGDMEHVRGPSLYLRLAERYSRMEGYTVGHFADRFAEAETELARWLDEGKLRVREHVEHGIENFPTTLTKLFDGGHIGKLLLEV
jgi:NADPH-dependent curcumin reductase CurA